MIGNEIDKHNVRLNITYKKRILHKQSNSPMSDTNSTNKRRYTMSNKTFNVSYWKQSTGQTGQCLSERGQKIYDTLAPIYEEVVGLPLSKMKLYKMSLEMSRGAKADEGFYIQNTATTAFMVLVQDMTSVCRAIRKGKEFKSMSYGSFNVTNLKDLAKSKLGRKRKVA
jgi:hypothetical protein